MEIIIKYSSIIHQITGAQASPTCCCLLCDYLPMWPCGRAIQPLTGIAKLTARHRVTVSHSRVQTTPNHYIHLCIRISTSSHSLRVKKENTQPHHNAPAAKKMTKRSFHCGLKNDIVVFTLHTPNFWTGLESVVSWVWGLNTDVWFWRQFMWLESEAIFETSCFRPVSAVGFEHWGVWMEVRTLFSIQRSHVTGEVQGYSR